MAEELANHRVKFQVSRDGNLSAQLSEKYRAAGSLRDRQNLDGRLVPAVANCKQFVLEKQV